MSTATLTSKGQITIPAVVRKALGLETGDRVEFIQVDSGRYELVAATLPASALRGLIPKPGQAVGVDAMNAAIRKRAGKDLPR